MMGQVKVYRNGSDVTRTCRAKFIDGSNSAIALSLDDSGWVFSAAVPGLSYLSELRCSVARGLSYSPDNLTFDVTESGQATYFGLLRFELDSSQSDSANAIGTAAALGGVVGGVIAATVVSVRAHNKPARPAGVVTVLDMSKTAASTYRRRFRHELKDGLVSSLPGQSQMAAPVVTRSGHLLSSQADLIGVKLIWFGIAQAEAPRLALRLQRSGVSPALEACPDLEVAHDGHVVRLPIKYKADTASKPAQEMVQAEVSEQMLETIASAKVVHLKACGLTRRLNHQAGLAGAQLLERYRSDLAERSVVPSTPPRATAAEGDVLASEPRGAGAPAAPALDATGADRR